MEEFFVVVGAYKEESDGQIKELQEAVERFRLPKFFLKNEIDSIQTTEFVFDQRTAKIGDKDKLVFLEKSKNPDLVAATRFLLSFGAKGVVVLFGNNYNRDYVREGKAYSAKEVKAMAEELIRLAPLFGRKIV